MPNITTKVQLESILMRNDNHCFIFYFLLFVRHVSLYRNLYIWRANRFKIVVIVVVDADEDDDDDDDDGVDDDNDDTGEYDNVYCAVVTPQCHYMGALTNSASHVRDRP